MERKIYLNQKQDQFIFSEDKFTCLKGTWGCGKSLAGLLWVNKVAEENPGNLILVIRKEWVDLRDATINDWNDLIQRKIVDNNVKYENGSVVMFRHGDDLNALKNTNLGDCLMVQAEEMTENDFWFINGRLRRKEGTRSIRLECNYDGRNWIYEQFNEKKIGKLITTNTFDNEKNLPPDYIPTLEKLPDRIKRVHLYGSDDYAEGLVWPEYDEKLHAVNSYEFPEEWKVAIGLDHGHNHPTVALFGAVDYDGRLIIYDEHFEAGKPISHHADRIKLVEPRFDELDQIIDHTCRYRTLQNGARVYSILEAYGDYGFHFRPSISDEIAGINFVSELFKKNKVLIFKDRCPNLVREIPQWKWKSPKQGQEKTKEAAVRINEDACKALIYLASGHFEAKKQEKKVVAGSVDAYIKQCEKEGQEFD